MKIIAEDSEIELDLPRKDVCLGQVIDEVEEFFLSVGRIPTALKIDGETLSQDELDGRLETLLSGEEVLEFGTITLESFIIDNLDGAVEANKQLVESVQAFADELEQAEKSVQPNQIIGEMNQFFDFWVRMQQLFPIIFKGVQFIGKDIDGHLSSFRGILEEIISALESQDVVLAMDLLQYEVIPHIEAMTEATPHLKTEVNRLAEESNKASEE